MKGFDNRIEQTKTNLKEAKENQINENLICIIGIFLGIVTWIILLFFPGYLAYTFEDMFLLSFILPFLFSYLFVLYFTRNWKKSIISGFIALILSFFIFIYLGLKAFGGIMH